MLRIHCPYCGIRDETEFRYRGDASLERPTDGAPLEDWHRHVYERTNPRGWHCEWWLHVGGCRSLLKVVRHTLTHEISAVGLPADALEIPGDAR
jgi:heterotetrameric sarcosine oxidase delta subunit